MVGQRQHFVIAPHARKSRMTRGARGAFATKAGLLNVHAFNDEFDVERITSALAMRGPCVCFRLQVMMYVDGTQTAGACMWILRQPVQQHG